MFFSDFLANPTASQFADVPAPENIPSAPYKTTLTHKAIPLGEEQQPQHHLRGDQRDQVQPI